MIKDIFNWREYCRCVSEVARVFFGDFDDDFDDDFD